MQWIALFWTKSAFAYFNRTGEKEGGGGGGGGV